MPTIGLCMIVKDEAGVILRCLASVRPLVDYVLIEDTGSTDGTQAAVREWLEREGLAGEVFDEPWRDFAYNRTAALGRLRENKAIDYALIMDADDVIEFDAGFDAARFKKGLNADLYSVALVLDTIRYDRPLICSNRVAFRYRGVLHEFLAPPSGEVAPVLVEGLHVVAGVSGTQEDEAEKYAGHATVLRQALQTEQDPFLRSRYTFYLAQSRRDSGQPRAALEAYLQRAEMGGWDEEIYVSLLNAARLQEQLGQPVDTVLATCERATAACPRRAEALQTASHLCRMHERYQEGCALAERGLAIARPAAGLFVEPATYEHGLLDEFAVNAFWVGRYRESLEACERILREGKIAAEERERIETNAGFAREKLAAEGALPHGNGQNTTMSKKLCLNMIVKNEMANLERCLTAVAPYISCWVIGDTGSTDGTQDYIRAFFAERGLPGELHEFPFIDFSQARNEALKRAFASKLKFDYLLLTDADMEFTVQDPAFSERLTAAVYQVLQRSGVTYWNSRLIARNANASYKGVTHEFLDVAQGETLRLEGVSFIDHATGSTRVVKYERDVRLLTTAMETERDLGMIARYTFYLANTLRDAGQSEAALKQYLKRAELGHWQQEVFASLYNAAKLKESLDHPADQVIAAYDAATDACPTRAEALHDAARFCRNKSLYERGYELAEKGLGVAYPKDGLFVVDWIYDYGLLDEFAVNAYWTGRYAECIAACDRLLAEGKLPANQRDRVAKNREFSVRKQQEEAESAASEAGSFTKLLRAARAKETAGASDEDVISAYMKAAEACPTRAEALHGVARFCRNKGLNERGYEFAARGLTVAYPQDATAVEDWIYDYGLLDEFAVNAYWTARYAECVDACDRLLGGGKLPTEQRERVQKNKQFAIGKLAEIQTPTFIFSDASASQNGELPKIPRIFHFIYLANPDALSESLPFSFVHFMAIRSALQVNKGFIARLYYNCEPGGPSWELAKREVELVRVDAPNEVFGKPVELLAHKADVLRLQILLEYGGIYLDIDTICQRPFEPLLDGRVVLGNEERIVNGQREPVGLCNAIIIAPPRAQFLRLWYETYREFVGGPSGDLWNKFSVQMPMRLAREHSELVRIEPAASFFWPSWDSAGIRSMFSENLEFPEAFSFHLWQGQSAHYLKSLDAKTVTEVDTTYNKIARRFVHVGEAAPKVPSVTSGNQISYAVRRVQEHYPKLDPNYIRLQLWYSTYVNLDRKYLYYMVPKAACTVMKLLIHSLEKLPPFAPYAGQQIEVRRDMFVHERSEFKLASLVDFDDRSQEYILTSPEFFRFAIVRDPYARLLSAWKDKVLTCAPGYHYLYYQIKGRLPQGNVPDSFITFPEFVAAISNDDLITCNPHWRSQVAHVFHPAMNFNFIGRLESLHEAVSTFVQRAGFAPAQIPPVANASPGGGAYDQALADRVYTLYERDFVDLDYARNCWKSSDTTNKPTSGVVSEGKFLDEIIERNIVISHLYSERANLRERVRELEQTKSESSLEACRTSSFDQLFERHISRIDGWVTKEEAAYLYGLAKAAAEGCIVEVGSYRGRSTAALAFGVNAGAGLPVFAVEPHERFRGLFGGEFGPVDRAHFMRTMAETGLYQHVRLVNVGSEFLADKWPTPVSVLFIDGDHRYEAVRRDFECWRGKLGANAAVVFDDATDPSTGSAQLWRQIVDSGAFTLEPAVGKMVCLRRARGM